MVWASVAVFVSVFWAWTVVARRTKREKERGEDAAMVCDERWRSLMARVMRL